MDKQDLSEVQRMVALDFGWNPQKLIDLDNKLDNFIIKEHYWNQQGRRNIMMLQTQIRAIKQRTGQFPTLQNSFERLLSSYPEEARKEHLLMRQYLKERFPGDTDAEIIEKLETYTIDELIQRPSISKAIHFELMVATHVKVNIIDGTEKTVRSLVDTELPAGQYWMYWDRKDDDGHKTPYGGRYSYRVLYNEKQETTGSLMWDLNIK